MKKLTLLLIAAVGIFVAACSTSGEADRIAEKISRGDVLTQSDYAVLIDYCGEYAQKAQTIQDKIDNLPSDDPSLKSLDDRLADVDAEYPHTPLFFKTLKGASQEEVGSENVKKIDRYASLIWFDAPEWAMTLSPEGDAGLIETVEPADSDLSIITAPELEMKEERK